MRSFKKTGIILGIAAAVVLILLLLDFLLYPSTFVRSDIHAVTTDRYDDLYLGTSHGKVNIDPASAQAANGRTAHNMCVGGEYAVDAYYIAKLVVEKGLAPRRIIYEVSPGYFVSQKEEGNNYLLFFHEFPLSRAKLAYFWDTVAGCNLRTMFFPWYEYRLSYELSHLGETVSRKWNGDYSADIFASSTQAYHPDGWLERYAVDSSGFTLGGLPEMFPEDIVPENMEYLEKLIALCAENDIEFIAVTTPLPADTLTAFYDGYDALNAYFQDFFDAQGVRFIDFNSDRYYPLAEHEAEYFTDLDGHMNSEAARAFSDLLARVIEDEDGVFEEYFENEGDVIG